MIRLAAVGLGSVLSICALSLAANSEIALELAQSPDEWSRCWQDLASDDAGQAYSAAWQLAQNPAPTLKLFRQQLSPAAAPNLEHIQTWLAELESPKFAVRDKASKELEKQGELAEAALRNVLGGKPGLETRQRVELLLDRLQTSVRSPDKLRMIRAAAVLEMLSTIEAMDLLAELAKGFPEHRLTREAAGVHETLATAFPNPRSLACLDAKSAPRRRQRGPLAVRGAHAPGNDAISP